MKFNPNPIEDSIDPLTELLLENSYLTITQATRVARSLLALADPAEPDEGD